MAGGDLGSFFFAYNSETISWNEALEYCEGLNISALYYSSLVEVTSSALHELLITEAATLPDQSWWLGGSDILEVLYLK